MGIFQSSNKFSTSNVKMNSQNNKKYKPRNEIIQKKQNNEMLNTDIINSVSLTNELTNNKSNARNILYNIIIGDDFRYKKDLNNFTDKYLSCNDNTKELFKSIIMSIRFEYSSNIRQFQENSKNPYRSKNSTQNLNSIINKTKKRCYKIIEQIR